MKDERFESGYCPNKKCRLFNEYQGDWGKEESKFLKCDYCESKLKPKKLK